MNQCKDQKHPNYMKHIPRLNRIEGQINGIKKMIEDRRYCTDIIMQIKAIKAACNSIEALMLETHLESCVADAFNSNNKKSKKNKIQELTKLYKK